MTGAMPISQSPFSGSFSNDIIQRDPFPTLSGTSLFPVLEGNAYRIFRSKYHQWKEKWLFFQRTWNGPDSFRDSNIIPDKLKICKLVYIIMAGNFFQNCFICRWNGRNDQTAHQRCGLVSVSFYFTYWTETAGRSIKYDMDLISWICIIVFRSF